MAGDTLDEAVEVAGQLNMSGFSVSLDLLGEEVVDEESAERAIDEYLEGLNRIQSEGLDANISVKPTQLGLVIDEKLATDAIARLSERAAAVGTTVTIDMEDSRYTASTVNLFAEAQVAHGNLGIAIQAYLRRTSDDLQRLSPLGGHIRLCKGAYVEDESVAFTSRDDVHRAFGSLLGELMSAETTVPAIATHNGELIEKACELSQTREAPFEFQMLYGVRSDMQRQLIEDGYPVRIYLPYGSQWYPYLSRRLAERPANAWFFARALFGG